MSAMSSTNGGDAAGVARGRQPVVNRGADLPALHRRLAGTVMAGDEQHDPVAPRDRQLEQVVDCIPCLVEIVAVKVEHAIRLDPA
jgi:hypothetical protein